MELRAYQTDIIGETRSKMVSGCRSILLQSPTGSGKTLLTAYMLKTAAQKQMASLFICHRRELIKQSINTFAEVGVKHGVIANGFMEDCRHFIQIGSVQTLARRLNKFKKPALIIWDECHHVASKSWASIHAAFPNAYHIGLTATPERLDGHGLGKWFKEMINGPSVAWLIENGFLAPYKLFAPPSVNLKGIHTRMGDYAKGELSQAVDKPTITGDAIKHYQSIAPGKRAVVFCVSIEHSKHVVSQFNAAGIPAAHVDGETEIEERDESIRRFRNGEIKVLSNVELFGEGFDLPALEVAILLRPTQSLGLYLQQVGRSLRPHPGKSYAIILDHAGNTQRHGLPDEEREWSLDGSIKRGKAGDNSPAVKICGKCYAAQSPGRLSCRFCGFVFQVNPREVEQVEGNLQEIDIDRIRQQRKWEQGSANTEQELIAIGRKRGYKRPELWARYVIRARQAKRVSA